MKCFRVTLPAQEEYSKEEEEEKAFQVSSFSYPI